MEKYTNDKGEEVVIAEMESRRLIHAIAKYAKFAEQAAHNDTQEEVDKAEALVKALKDEAIKRLTPNE